jgi:DNA-binding PadR family transcriptional regulator
MSSMERIRKRFVPMSETMLYILFSLREERHGYGVVQYVKEKTKGRIVLGAGTIYQSIGKLEKEGLIVATQEIERKKMYLITDIGKQILSEEAARIKEIYDNLEDLI